MSTRKCRGNSLLASLNRKKRRAVRVESFPRDSEGKFSKMTFVENYRFNSITLPWER